MEVEVKVKDAVGRVRNGDDAAARVRIPPLTMANLTAQTPLSLPERLGHASPDRQPTQTPLSSFLHFCRLTGRGRAHCQDQGCPSDRQRRLDAQIRVFVGNSRWSVRKTHRHSEKSTRRKKTSCIRPESACIRESIAIAVLLPHGEKTSCVGPEV